MDYFETCDLIPTKITTGRCKIFKTVFDNNEYYMKKVPTHLISREYKVGLLINDIGSPHFMKTIGMVKRNNKSYLVTLRVNGKHLSPKRNSNAHLQALQKLYYELIRCNSEFGFTHYDINKNNIIYQPTEYGFCAVLIDFGRSYIHNPDGWDNKNYQYENGGYIDFNPICPDLFLDLSFFANTLAKNGFDTLKTLLPNYTDTSPYAFGLELSEIFKNDYWLLIVDPYVTTQPGSTLTTLISLITSDYNIQHSLNVKWYNINKHMIPPHKITDYINAYSHTLTHYKLSHVYNTHSSKLIDLQRIISSVLLL